MSGGHWEYSGFRIEHELRFIADDEDVKSRWPRIASLIESLAKTLSQAEHAMDLDLSGDQRLDNDPAFEDRICHAILEAAMKVADDRLFPKGKWATIQAAQERMALNETEHSLKTAARVSQEKARISQEKSLHLTPDESVAALKRYTHG